MFNVMKLVKAVNVISCVVISLSIAFLCTANPSDEMSLTQIAIAWGIALAVFIAGAAANRWSRIRLESEKEYQQRVSHRRIDREIDKHNNVVRVNFSNR